MSWRTQGFADRDAIARIPSWLNPLAQAPPVNLVSEAVEHLYVAPGPAFGIGVHATRAGMRVWGQGECIRVRHSLSSGKQPNATKHQQYRTSKEY